MKTDRELTIGQVAKLASVNTQTLRYYERRNILVPLARKDSGYRVYGKEAVKTVRFIKHAQELGFTLEDIEALLDLRANHSSECGRVQARAMEKLSDVESKIARLENIRKSLKSLIMKCRKKRTNTRCPILESFDDGEVAL